MTQVNTKVKNTANASVLVNVSFPETFPALWGKKIAQLGVKGWALWLGLQEGDENVIILQEEKVTDASRCGICVTQSTIGKWTLTETESRFRFQDLDSTEVKEWEVFEQEISC